MLETRNLCKIYKPRKGVPVTAINNVSLKFPDKGMIFLLGKSGSGKSTLLNLLGGLDRYNSGEIIIKGVSSKDFKQQHFDSYRNTYVGFIFQEYNVLEEFTVGANIALSIELQGRKADDGQINTILKEVDLEGYGNRKPNELSGGQKQRVAIARALVKNPEIIMADEPTGALDSNTGRQVLQTLKKLSSDKLVIVVSHDREFAEQYGDRIIELADGVVINDIENYPEALEVEGLEQECISFKDNVVSLPKGYHLTDEDRNAINEYIDSLEKGVDINISSKSLVSRRFRATDQESITSENKSSFKLIKSKLPLKNAFIIGGSGLKYKKVRLFFTILLSFVAFTLFALADTFGSYNHIKTCTNSLIDSKITYASVIKAKKLGEGLGTYWKNWGYKLTDEEVEKISKDTGNTFKGVYVPVNLDLSFGSNYDNSTKLNEGDYALYMESFSGFSEISNQDLASMSYQVSAGRLPDGTKDEIAISKFACETFVKAKYSDGQKYMNDKGQNEQKYQSLTEPKDIIGKTLTLGGKQYTITGVVDTGFDKDRYDSLLEDSKGDSTADQLVKFLLYNEMYYSKSYSLTGAVMVGEGFIDRLMEGQPKLVQLTNSYLWFGNDSYSIDGQYVAKLSDIDSSKVTWINGTKTVLGDKEIIITADSLNSPGDKLGGSYSVDLDENNSFTMNFSMDGSGENLTEEGYKVVGIIEPSEDGTGLSRTFVINDTLFNKCNQGNEGTYSYAVSAMPKEKEEIRSLVSYCYDESSDIRYDLQSSVTYELNTVNTVLKVMSKVFLYIGIGFAVFAALMLANFIGTSISYKKQEIGILRAIGSRSNDVFRIFFAESFIIAMINFLLSCIGTFAATLIVNKLIRTRAGVLITVLNFSIRQIVLLFIISIVVALLASFIPVKKIASKRPIDAIRNR
jgi:ABC-type lipoprotein export system ATPase subunit